jgi:hypothetical protein
MFNEGRLLTAGEAGKRAGVSTRDAERELRAIESWGVAKKVNVESRPAPLKISARAVKSPKPKKTAKQEGSEDMWMLDANFQFLRPLSAFVHEVSPMRHEKIVTALRRGGRLAAVILSGHFLGDPSRPADLIVAADAFNERRLDQAVRQLEPMFGREIRYAAFSTPEFRYRLTIQDRLIRDTLDYPHLVLLDKTRLL